MKYYLFDIDGTLTPARQSIQEDFEEFFYNWMKNKKVFLVTGSNLPKVYEQLTKRIIDSCAGVFCSMANELYINNKEVYSNKFDVPRELIDYLNHKIVLSKCPVKRTLNFEYRPGMLNYSVIGRDCTQEERTQYYEWDKQTKEREQIANHINLVYPNIEACIGGQISIDIQPKGYNKSLASKWIRSNLDGEIIFFGDRTFKGGNDYDICYDIEKNEDGKYYQIDDQEELKNILSSL